MQVAKNEERFQGLEDKKSRSEARQTAIEYVKAKLPQWTIKGVASHPYRDNNFWIDIDIENRGRSAVITIYAQKFFPESGDPYWKVVPTDTTLPQRLHDMKDMQILEQLRQAENDLEEKRNQP